MNTNTKTILIASSIFVLGGVVILMMRNSSRKKRSYSNDASNDNQGGNTTIDTSLKGVDITRGGTHIPTKEEFDAWKKANPFNLQLPTLKEMLKGTNWLKIGEVVPKSTTTTTTTSNYGIDPNKLAQWKTQFGVK
jgi:hypothetical protein